MDKERSTETTTAAIKRTKLKTDSLRVRRETKKKIQAEVAVINRKSLGRPITPDDYVALAITLIRPDHLEGLKDRSLSNRDRLEKRFQDYCATNGKVSKDEFLGVLLQAGTETVAER